jgi:quinol-cytochrome oxidoreductase complex cytochrome b subunit
MCLAAIVFMIALEVLFGIILAIQYSPSTPYASTAGLYRFDRSIHHWISALLILVGGFTVLWGLFTGAYRTASKLEWGALVALLALFMLFQLTGHILPGDQHAVRTAVVETGIAQNVPVVGPIQAGLIRGGTSVSPKTLGIWYDAHVFFLVVPLLIGAWFLRNGVGTENVKTRIRIFSLAAVPVIVCSVFWPRLGPSATPADYGNYNANPEWYTLPLHDLLSIANSISPSLAFVATMVIPGLVFLLVFGAPWIDRSKKERPVYGQALASCIVLGTILLLFSGRGQAVASPIGPNPYSDTDSKSTGPAIKLDPLLIAKGQKLFTQNCDDCHSIGGKGGNAGPALDGVANRHDFDWQIAHINEPRSKVPSSTMPAFSSLGQGSIQAIAEYLETLR